MKASEFDRKFDDNESVLAVLDLASARKLNLAHKKVNGAPVRVIGGAPLVETRTRVEETTVVPRSSSPR